MLFFDNFTKTTMLPGVILLHSCSKRSRQAGHSKLDGLSDTATIVVAGDNGDGD